ncbi:Uncharacterised protein [Mycobacteroides abscessus subsp. abscessus]|nr:Uncharacterised protein [Mycobacteroides abscessus subsp. abscessus]
MKTIVKRIAYFLFGEHLRAATAFVATYAPRALRNHLLTRLGVDNEGTIGRRVRFVNTAVRIGPGARVGNYCRFEGGAVITIAEGVTLPPRTVVTTVASLDGYGIRYDIPVTVTASGIEKTA